MSLRQVTGPMASAAVVAPGMLSVVGHYEFRDGARFRLRYSVDPQDSCCFIQVEDDVGLHFGFLGMYSVVWRYFNVRVYLHVSV